MFFFAFVGAARFVQEVQSMLQTQARRWGLASHSEDIPLPDGSVLLASRLDVRDPLPPLSRQLPGGPLVLRVSQPAWDDGGAGRTPSVLENQIEFLVHPSADSLTISLPPASPEPLYFARDPRGWAFGNDQRLLLRWVGGELDERAVHAILQYGAVPAPFTFSRRVHRVPAGHRLRLKRLETSHQLEPIFRPGAEDPPEGGRGAPGFLEEVDRLLVDVPDPALLCFSGGVDSGLLAARLARLGRRGIELLNLSFGEEDPEAELARRMASHLGMKMAQVRFDLSTLSLTLDRISEVYSVPFCDLSTLPTYLLVEEGIRRLGKGGTVIEGTGADGAFGVGNRYPTWRRWYGLPLWARKTGGWAYRRAALWRMDSRSRLETLGRIARRSVQMPLAHAAVLAVNSMEGIAYETPRTIKLEIEAALSRHVEALASACDEWTQLSFLDLVHVCAGIYAAKSFDPLRAKGLTPLYPFLQTRVLARALALEWGEKCPSGESKGMLKTLLAEEVPAEMVYRPKSGFLPPFREVLAHPSMQEFLRSELLSDQSPLSGFGKRAKLVGILDRGASRKSLSQGAQNLVWALAFTSAWYRRNASPAGDKP